MTKKKILGSLKIIIPLLVGIYLVWYFFSNMSASDEELFYSSIKKANYFWIVISILLSFISNLSRAYRWKYVLEPLGHESKFWHRYHAIMIGYLINFTIPRAGEASRAGMLYRSDGIPFSTSFGSIITERVVDLVMLLSIAFATSILCYNDFYLIKDLLLTKFGKTPSDTPFNYSLFITIATILLLFVGLLLWKVKKLREKIFSFIKGIFLGFFSIFKSKNPLSYIFHTLVIWICYIGMFWVCLYALPETSDFPVKGVFLGFLAGSLGIIFTNGGMGVYPIVVGFVIAHYLGDHPDSLGIGNALGMIIWTSQTITFILLGLISLSLLPKNYTKKDEQN